MNDPSVGSSATFSNVGLKGRAERPEVVRVAVAKVVMVAARAEDARVAREVKAVEAVDAEGRAEVVAANGARLHPGMYRVSPLRCPLKTLRRLERGACGRG